LEYTVGVVFDASCVRRRREEKGVQSEGNDSAEKLDVLL